MATSLRELLIDIKVKVDKSGVKASDAALAQATTSASTFEKALIKVAAAHDKISAAQKRLQASNAANDSAFAKITGLNSRAGISPRAPRPGGIGSMAAPDIFAPAPKTLTRLEELKVRARAAFASVGEKVKAATDTVDSFAAKLFTARNAVAGFAAVIVAREIGQFIGDVIQTGKSLAEMSNRTHVSVESLQGWRALVAKAGIDTGVLETSFRKLSKASRASEKATSPQAKAFKDLGVDAQNASKTGLRPIEDIMVDVGTALAAMTDETAASAIATQLLGPAGYGLVPAFEAGGDAVRKFLETAKENVSVSTEEAKRLKLVGDSVDRAGVKWTGLKNRLVIALLPALEFVAQKFEKVSKWLFDVAKNTKVFQTILGALAAGGIARLIVMLAAWVTRAGGAQVVMKMLGQGLLTAARWALEFIAPLLIIEDFLVFLAGGKSLFGRAFNEIFGEGGAKKVREGLLSVFSKMKDVIGELGSAITGIGSSDLFTGLAKAGLDLILVVLNEIGVALGSDTDKANALAAALERSKERLKKDVSKALGITEESRMPQQEKGITGADGKINYDAPTGSWLVDHIPYGKRLANHLRGSALTDGAGKADYDRNNLQNSSVVPPPSAAEQNSSQRSVTLTDNRTIEVNVSGGDKPGETGRATASAVSGALETDSRQTLSSVSE